MIKNNKFKIVVAAVVTLLPMLLGVIMWNKLPDTLAVHWGPNGNPDGFASKEIVVFLFPLILEVVFWFCVCITAKDNSKKEQSKKAEGLVIWIIPAVSLVVGAIMYCTALGFNVSVPAVMCWFFGIIALVIGNYMPKIKQNRTIGIKIPWALRDEQNWNATHRFGGKVWVVSGVLILACSFLPPTLAAIVFTALIVLTVAVPTVYSYIYYKKQKGSGK